MGEEYVNVHPDIRGIDRRPCIPSIWFLLYEFKSNQKTVELQIAVDRYMGTIDEDFSRVIRGIQEILLNPQEFLISEEQARVIAQENGLDPPYNLILFCELRFHRICWKITREDIENLETEDLAGLLIDAESGTEWSNDNKIYFVVHYSTTDGSFSSEAELPVYDFSAWPSGSRTVSFDVSRLLNRDGYIRLEGRSNSPYGERWFYTNPIWVRIPPQFNELPSLFASNSFHVVGNEAYCTDVLGTANFSWIFGQKNMQMQYGRTDTILQSSEHDTSNLLITGGPAVNPLAQEFDEEFGITYTIETSFTISCENQSISLPLYQYPRKDIGIVYLGRQNGRYILLAWGYGWRGTYAATVIMSHPDLWAFYGSEHFLFIQWEDAYPYDGLVTWNEIRVVYPYHHSLSSPPPGNWYLYQPTFEYMQYLFGGNSIHVAGDTAYCTDVLGTAHVSWIFGRYYLQRPEGRTDLVLPSTEHGTANLIITGGPAVNPLAVEMGSIQNFNISYNYQPSLPEPYFEIISDNYSYRLYLRDYPRKDICIIHLGRQGNRNVLVIWGYGWRGTYAGTLIMATPSFWYTNYHMMLLEWNDYNYDGLVQLSEISVKYTAYNPHIIV